MNALANPRVGDYVNRHFVSAFQKVATFQINGDQKQGGNVAVYFCTPQGRVLHAVAGPVDAATLLREAQWANEIFQLAQLEKQTPAQFQNFFRKAHLDRFQRGTNLPLCHYRLPIMDSLTPSELHHLLEQSRRLGLNNQDQVHLLLSVAPLPRLEQIYQIVFEKILNEKISTEPVAVVGE